MGENSLGEPELYVDGNEGLDVFATSTSPGPFKLAVFYFLKHCTIWSTNIRSTTIWIQFGGNEVLQYYKFISWDRDDCHLLFVFGIQMGAVMPAYCHNSVPKMLTFNDTDKSGQMGKCGNYI